METTEPHRLRKDILLFYVHTVGKIHEIFFINSLPYFGSFLQYPLLLLLLLPTSEDHFLNFVVVSRKHR